MHRPQTATCSEPEPSSAFPEEQKRENGVSSAHSPSGERRLSITTRPVPSTWRLRRERSVGRRAVAEGAQHVDELPCPGCAEHLVDPQFGLRRLVVRLAEPLPSGPGQGVASHHALHAQDSAPPAAAPGISRARCHNPFRERDARRTALNAGNGIPAIDDLISQVSALLREARFLIG